MENIIKWWNNFTKYQKNELVAKYFPSVVKSNGAARAYLWIDSDQMKEIYLNETLNE